MRTTDWKFVVEVTGIAAIVASLVFVGMEMRQTRMLAMAAAYQARTDSEISIQLALLEAGISDQIGIDFQATDLTPEERSRFRLILETRLMYWENVHYQWENGLLTDQFWRANVNSIRAIMLNNHGYDYWQINSHVWRESFQKAVDEVMDEWDQSQDN